MTGFASRGTLYITDTIAQDPSGSRVGMYCLFGDAADGGRISEFRAHYVKVGHAARRTILVASANGELWSESFPGFMEQVSSNLSLASDRNIQAVERGQKLYIADWGDVKAAGTDGVRGTGNDKFDSASYTNWTTGPTASISAYDDVLVISAPTHSDITAGTYEISSVAAGELTLASSPFTGTNGTCTFRIERAPKVYDPTAGTLALWTATSGKGQVPTGCPAIERYMDCAVLAGEHASPHVWYMCRSQDWDDWDYSADGTDEQRAVAGTDADAGTPGEPIVFLKAHSDDFMVMGCSHSIYRMAGHPASGGRLDDLSRSIGGIHRAGVCKTGAGEMVFMGTDGLYMLQQGAKAYPTALSRDALPEELSKIDAEIHDVLMAYDHEDDGIHIFLTTAGVQDTVHYWFSWKTRSFWPVSMASTNYEPFSIIANSAETPGLNTVILGCRDGYLRRFHQDQQTDDGTSMTNYVNIGPVPLAPDGARGILAELEAVLAEGSGTVTWNLYGADTPEDVWDASSFDNGEWTDLNGAGLNYLEHPRAGGQCFVLKLTGSGTTKWALERATGKVEASGPLRLG